MSCETDSLQASIRSCVIAALHVTSNHEELEIFLKHCDVNDVLAAVEFFGVMTTEYEKKTSSNIEQMKV